MLDQVQRRLAQFGGIVRRDAGRHAHRDARRAVGEQVRERAGQDDRLAILLIVVGAEIDRVLADAVQQQRADLGHPRFGVAVGRRAVAVDIAEIALAVDQPVAHREVLRQPHQRLVDRLVAMGVEVAHHVADDLGALAVGGVRVQAQQAHHIKDAPVHRLHPVARVRQRAVHDGRQRVGEIALLKRGLEVDRFYVPAGRIAAGRLDGF